MGPLAKPGAPRLGKRETETGSGLGIGLEGGTRTDDLYRIRPSAIRLISGHVPDEFRGAGFVNLMVSCRGTFIVRDAVWALEGMASMSEREESICEG